MNKLATFPLRPASSAASEPVRWTRAQFNELLELGVIEEGARVELLDGEIFTMAVQNPPHYAVIRACEVLLTRAFGEGFEVRSQAPFALDDDSEPEPDIAVVPGSFRDYQHAHPTTAVLLVEVSDSTLARDQGKKKDAYARNGIPEYWIVNLPARRLEVFRHPSRGVYTEAFLLEPDRTVAPLTRPDVVLSVADLLPAQPGPAA